MIVRSRFDQIMKAAEAWPNRGQRMASSARVRGQGWPKADLTDSDLRDSVSSPCHAGDRPHLLGDDRGTGATSRSPITVENYTELCLQIRLWLHPLEIAAGRADRDRDHRAFGLPGRLFRQLPRQAGTEKPVALPHHHPVLDQLHHPRQPLVRDPRLRRDRRFRTGRPSACRP